MMTVSGMRVIQRALTGRNTQCMKIIVPLTLSRFQQLGTGGVLLRIVAITKFRVINMVNCEIFCEAVI